METQAIIHVGGPRQDNPDGGFPFQYCIRCKIRLANFYGDNALVLVQGIKSRNLLETGGTEADGVPCEEKQ